MTQKVAQRQRKRCRKRVRKEVAKKRRIISRSVALAAFLRRVYGGENKKITQIRSLCRWVYSTVRYVLLSCGLFFSMQTVNRGFNLVCMRNNFRAKKKEAERFLNAGKLYVRRFSLWMPSPATTRRSWSLEGGDAVFVFF